MKLLVWDGSLDLGIEEVDKQHAYLFDVINSLYRKIRKGQNREAIRDVVDSMKNFARYHFELEERLLRESGYPEAEKHAQAHARFTEEMEKYEFLEDADVISLPGEALSFLINWIVWHIMNVDVRYVDHLKKHLAEQG